jgi:hypothetical protein
MTRSSEADWAERLIVAAVRHPLSMRMYAEAPYVPELYRAGLEARVVHPAKVGAYEIAPPLLLNRPHKRWFAPGNLDDLLLHTSCAIACCNALLRQLPADVDAYDRSPPVRGELKNCSLGNHPMRYYWMTVDRLITEHFTKTGFSHVVFADIGRCIESIDVVQISSLLREARADESAVEWLGRMHQSWQRAGCDGLPMAPGFRLLLKFYLREVDQRLHSAGFCFVRLQDDFRILCNGVSEGRRALDVLLDALAVRGLKLNDRKTHVITRAQYKRSWQRWHADCSRIFGEGIGIPALAEAVRSPILRPAAVVLLRRLYTRRCQFAF